MKKNLVILGGGYGGMSIVNELLQKELPNGISIILVDQLPFQGIKTEYYALAAGTIAEKEIRVSFPNSPHLLIKHGIVTAIDLENKSIHIHDHDPLSYEWLVIGLGCTDKYHDIAGAEQYTSSIQSFTAARKAYTELMNVKPYGQVSIVGGGLSGVETASELRESRPDLNIRIIDRGPSILSSFPAPIQSFAAAWFQENDVQLLGNTSLFKVEKGILHAVDASKEIVTDVTLWTAGIQPVALVQRMNREKDKLGRLLINSKHQLIGDPHVFVVGDCAALPFSPSAQVAGVQGEQIAKVLQSIWYDTTLKLEPIKLKGVLGSLGKKNGFGMMGTLSIRGRIPRLIKNGVLWRSKHHKG